MLLLLVLIGCNKLEDKGSSKTTEEHLTSITNEEKEPPAIHLVIGDNEIKTYRGTYTWTYFDQSTGQNVTTIADHLPPNEMVDMEQGIKVNLTEPVKLNFEQEPTQFEIRLWDNNGVIKTYNSFEEVQEKGKYIVEIIGNWEDSMATYVVALDIE